MVTGVSSLLLPVIVSGLVLFAASCVIWMVLPHHKSDWRGLPNEASFVDALRGGGLEPGQYMFPYAATPDEWNSASFKERMKTGPSGLLYVWSKPCNMGSNMFCTWLLFTALSFIIAYLAGMALPPGSDFLQVVRFVGTAGILTYGSSGLLNSIWFRRKILGDVLDGIAYGLLTGVVFALLWPAAT